MNFHQILYTRDYNSWCNNIIVSYTNSYKSASWVTQKTNDPISRTLELRAIKKYEISVKSSPLHVARDSTLRATISPEHKQSINAPAQLRRNNEKKNQFHQIEGENKREIPLDACRSQSSTRLTYIYF